MKTTSTLQQFCCKLASEKLLRSNLAAGRLCSSIQCHRLQRACCLLQKYTDTISRFKEHQLFKHQDWELELSVHPLSARPILWINCSLLYFSLSTAGMYEWFGLSSIHRKMFLLSSSCVRMLEISPLHCMCPKLMHRDRILLEVAIDRWYCTGNNGSTALLQRHYFVLWARSFLKPLLDVVGC